MGYRISVDVGGTFTDLTLADGEAFLGRHKSPTTPEDLTQGVFDCLRLASQYLAISLRELLNRTDVFIHGSTTATNAVIEEQDGDKMEYTALMVNRPYKGLTHVQHRTGHSTAIGARMLYKGEITKKGAFPPELGVYPKPFFRELARRELEVAVTSRTFI